MGEFSGGLKSGKPFRVWGIFDSKVEEVGDNYLLCSIYKLIHPIIILYIESWRNLIFPTSPTFHCSTGINPPSKEKSFWVECRTSVFHVSQAQISQLPNPSNMLNLTSKELPMHARLMLLSDRLLFRFAELVNQEIDRRVKLLLERTQHDV